MLRIIVLLNIFFSVFLNLNAQSTGGGYVSDEIFIRFKDSASEQQKEILTSKYGLTLKRKFIVSKSILYKIKSGIKPEELQLALNEEEIVQFSSLNKIQVIQPRSSIDFSGEPGFINQWYINEHPSSIDWLDAMEIYSPKENVSVAVIDSGISFAHPDLANLENRGGMIAEINGINGFDDDGLGLIDDKHGWDFINWDNIAEDNDGHGTMVSGIIAAESSNGLGIVGIAPDSYIIPLKVVAGGTTDEQIKLAFDYAITAGAKIINFSAGFISYNTFEADIQEILFTLEKDYDILLILAADNGRNYGEPGFGYDTDLFPDYPVSYDGNVTLTVANSNQQLELHPSSSWGLNSVDLAAPGTDIFGLDIQQGTIPFFAESFNSYSNQWTSGSNSLTNYSPYIWGYYQDIYGVNWVTDSAYDAYGNNLYYTAYTDTFLSSPAFDLSLINAPFLSVNIFHDLPYNWLLGSYDLLIFEASIDNGISWIPIGLPRYGTTLYPGQKYTFPLYRFQGQSSVKIRFRLKSDGIYQGDGVYISDFSIFGKSPSFIYTGTEYQWNVGTSFATPIVSGVAAMLLSHRPELSTQDVRKIILQSVTKVDGLADKVASGGIVNAYEAIKLADAWEIETEAPLFYTLSSSVSPTGAGSVSGTGSYEEGSTASLSAESADGYVFSHWSGDASGSSNPVSVTINQDMSIVANFSATDTPNESSASFNLSSSVSPTGAGSVSGIGSYEEGSTASLSAESADGYVFSHWSGDASGSSNPISVTINQDMSIVANFSATDNPNESSVSFNLSSSVSPTGAGSVYGTGSYEEGSTASLSAESADGYVFSHWSGDASDSSNPISVTINQDMSIVAHFSATDNSNSWSSSSNIGNNLKFFSWFGQFFEINSNWIYHLKLGWLYRHGDNLTSLWFYSSKHGWLFTSKNIFPYLFQHSKDSWIYLQDNQLYSWANQSWTAI